MLEELARAELDLPFDRALERLRPIAALVLLERIAPGVELEGLGILATILERLAERKAEVVAVDERGATGLDLLAHRGELLVGEAIGLEVGKAPVRVAEVDSLPGRFAIGALSLFAAALRLEGMTERQVQLRVAGLLPRQFSVERDGCLGRAFAHEDAGQRHPVCRVVRFCGNQDLDLLAGLLVTVQGDQREHVVVAGRPIARRGLEHGFEQRGRVLRELVLVRDLRQHPQRFDVVRLAPQVAPG